MLIDCDIVGEYIYVIDCDIVGEYIYVIDCDFVGDCIYDKCMVMIWWIVCVNICIVVSHMLMHI